MRRQAKRAAATGLKLAAAGVDVARRPAARSGVVVLIYHRVGGRSSASAIDLPTEQFDEQVGELAAAGRIVSLDAAADLLSSGAAVDGPPKVVLTFDDGTADWVDHALPILVRHGAPATFYVATDFVERGVEFPGEGTPISWAGLGELTSTGLATIGSHTHTHLLLDRAGGPEAAAELDRSIELVGERLGVECRHFAYPKALLGSTAAEAEVRSRFRTAAVAGTTANRPGATDLHRLARTPVQTGDGMRWFRRKAAGGMALEDRARQVLNRRRYAGAVS